MADQNTTNICIGHLPFPHAFNEYIDLMVAPKFIPGINRLLVVEDTSFGLNGHSLSEYGQLIWAMRYIDEIAPHSRYIRVFHYRRFVSRQLPPSATSSSNQSWTSTISANSLSDYREEFTRQSSGELFNTPVEFPGGIIGQYAEHHLLEDFLRFTEFLLTEHILTSHEAARFLGQPKLIASSSVGLFEKNNLKDMFTLIEKAAQFINAPLFISRDGYQRRTAGFLLERFQSYLIMRRIEAGKSPAMYGHNIVVSEDEQVRLSL